MATQANSTRLLAKVAKFVRNPSVHWGDLDKMESDPEAEPTLTHNRQTLKDMIDRKRHEDAIRKCEFDELRQLRRQASLTKPDVSDKSSSLGTSTGISDLDDRALTIRKIDEIEAQMSKQWWKGQKPAPLADAVPPSAPSPALSASADSLFASTQVKNSQFDFDDIPTLLGQVPTSRTGTPSHAAEAPFNADQQVQETDDRGFDPAKLFASELNDNLADPDLEEAAVRFANGDDAGAEAVLLTALRAQPALTVVAQAQAEALFDLYRSLRQQANFEREALAFVQQFGAPAPAWLPSAKAPGNQPVGGPQALHWHCPAQLDLPALAQLPSHLPAPDGLSLDWSSLKQITAPAAQQLAALFAAWSTQEGCLHFEGESVLAQVLRAATPRGVRQTEAFWWTLRMDLLRILQWQDDFELAALEFCMTYETAPGPWYPAKCGLRQQVPAAAPNTSTSHPMSGPTLPPQVVALTGELQGDVVPGLPVLTDASQPPETLIISCSELIRVDFSAAGSILNWVARGQALGRQIEFTDVSLLVAAFFNLIGINQHAQVLTRSH